MDEQRLRELYDAFNTRDTDTALAAMTNDVDWPNGWEGGRVHGREAVRSYWERQWAQLDSRVEPVTISTRSDGRLAVEVHQVARSLAGDVLWDGPVCHVYKLRKGLIARMDIEEIAAAG
jgi:nuclear transport factor 2 (NTF2) superfamily protein